MLSPLGRVGRQKETHRCTGGLGLQDKVQMLLRLLHTCRTTQQAGKLSTACCLDMAVGNMLG